MRLDLLPELGSTWCRDVGEAGPRPALVLLHGGPGYNCEYLRRFEQFAHTGRRVVRYDQIGSGRSVVGDEHYVPYAYRPSTTNHDGCDDLFYLSANVQLSHQYVLIKVLPVLLGFLCQWQMSHTY